MATHFSVVIDAMLRDSIIDLASELKRLEFQYGDLVKKIYLNHDGENIIIHAPIQLKAYIPKLWDGWEVLFVEFKGPESIIMDIDEPVDLYDELDF